MLTIAYGLYGMCVMRCGPVPRTAVVTAAAECSVRMAVCVLLTWAHSGSYFFFGRVAS